MIQLEFPRQEMLSGCVKFCENFKQTVNGERSPYSFLKEFFETAL